MIKKSYRPPKLTVFGGVEVITKALGSSSAMDQSDWPEEFPPDGGKYDVIAHGSNDCVT